MSSNKRPEFSEIRVWLQEHLGQKNNLILGNDAQNRRVIVNGIDGPKAYSIPVKTRDNIESFKNAWIDIYLACLKYLNSYITNLFATESLTLADENTVIVGNQKFVFSTNMDNITYINTLERIANAYNNIEAKRKEAETINFKTTTVKIENPADKNFKKSDLIPKQEVNITNTEIIKKQIKQVEVESNIIFQKLSDDEVINAEDCQNITNKNLVFITCTNLSKGENTYRDNIEVINKNLPNTSKAAFISGTVLKEEQLNKEYSKIIKLCQDTINSKIIMYEINNKDIKNLSKEDIAQALNSVNKLLIALNKSGYKPMVCMDYDTNKTISKQVSFNFNYPLFLRILPRELEEVDKSQNLVIMDPQFDSDQVVIKNKNIMEYLNYNEAPQKVYQEQLVKI